MGVLDAEKKYPIRKPTRLKAWDYSKPGYYFVTICTEHKEKCLCSIVGEGLCALPSVRLTPIGHEVERSIRHIGSLYPTVSVDKYVVMPNHVHMILVLSDNGAGGRGSPPLHTVVGRLKSFTTKQYGGKLWQRSFHDHIIRGEKDYHRIWNYIDTNPAKWGEDCFYVP